MLPATFMNGQRTRLAFAVAAIAPIGGVLRGTARWTTETVARPRDSSRRDHCDTRRGGVRRGGVRRGGVRRGGDGCPVEQCSAVAAHSMRTRSTACCGASGGRSCRANGGGAPAHDEGGGAGDQSDQGIPLSPAPAPPPGAAEPDGQPHDARAATSEGSAPLPGDEPGGQVLRLPSRARPRRV